MTSQTWIPKSPPCISPKSKSPFYASYVLYMLTWEPLFPYIWLESEWEKASGVPRFTMRSNRSKHGPCVDVRAWLSPSPGMAFEPGTQVRGHLPRYTKVMLQWSVILIPDQLCTALPLPCILSLCSGLPYCPCSQNSPSHMQATKRHTWKRS